MSTWPRVAVRCDVCRSSISSRSTVYRLLTGRTLCASCAPRNELAQLHTSVCRYCGRALLAPIGTRYCGEQCAKFGVRRA